MILENVKGLIYGCAIGDAFGMATEMMTQEKIKSEVGKIIRPIDSLEDSIISKNRTAGSITDDTYNTLMMIDMLCDSKGEINVELYLSKLKEWSNDSPIAEFVTGPSTSRALELIENGTPITETGKMGTTNGAAMKISPLGIVLDYNNIPLLVEKVAEICMPTHNTTIAITGASIVASLSSYTLRGGKSQDKIWSIIMEVIDEAKKYGYNWPTASLKYRINHAKTIVQSDDSEEIKLSRIYNEIGCSMETIETIPTALAIVYMANGNPLKSAQLSAIIGGDTDTIGAISTAICGAMNPNFPEEIVSMIEKTNNISFSQIFNKVERII